MKLTLCSALVLASLATPLAASPAARSTPRRLVAQHGSGGAGLHGGGGARPKPSEKVAEVSYADGVERDRLVEDFLRALAVGLKTQDGKPMVPRLADTYAIEGLPAEMNPRDAFVMALGMATGPNAIIIQSVARTEAGFTAKTEFRYTNRIVARTFRFDADGRLLATDLIVLRRRPVPPTDKPSGSPEAAK